VRGLHRPPAIGTDKKHVSCAAAKHAVVFTGPAAYDDEKSHCLDTDAGSPSKDIEPVQRPHLCSAALLAAN